MNRLIRSTVVGTMILVLAILVLAASAESQAKEKKAKKVKPAAVPAAFKLPAGITLSAEQQAKLDEIKTEFATRLADAQKKVDDVYTDEQKAARMAAREEAAAAGKKGKELRQAVAAAVTLTDEQRPKLTAAEKELKQLNKEARKQVLGLLTAEQKQQLPAKKKA